MGNDGEGWCIGQSMGRGYEERDGGRARVQGARISGGSGSGKRRKQSRGRIDGSTRRGNGCSARRVGNVEEDAGERKRGGDAVERAHAER